jgi:hypothetical protein
MFSWRDAVCGLHAITQARVDARFDRSRAQDRQQDAIFVVW